MSDTASRSGVAPTVRELMALDQSPVRRLEIVLGDTGKCVWVTLEQHPGQFDAILNAFDGAMVKMRVLR